MAVLIRGMEMPKEDIMMILSPDGTVTFMDHKPAEAVEVPDQHGPLIDIESWSHATGRMWNIETWLDWLKQEATNER